MNHIRYIVLILVFALAAGPMWGQVDRREVRRGNKDFRKENYEMAFQDYLRAVEKDSSSIAANYNMANALYRMEQYDQAQQALDRIKDTVVTSVSAADYFFNQGDVALQKKDYQTAVKAFGESLILRPDDLQAKENFIYAKLMLQNQQNQNDQNQNDQNQDQNPDQNPDQNQQNQDNQDQNNKDQNDDQQNDQNQDNQDQNQNDDQQDGQNEKPQNQESQPQQQEAQISPQAAQQMLQAIQAKEKETQDKVNKKKAMALKSRQKDKNW